MAVHAVVAAAGCLLNDVDQAHTRGVQEYGAFLSAANNNSCVALASGAQSELTCNGGANAAWRKRGREMDKYLSSSAALLPIPGVAKPAAPAADRSAESAMASTSGRAPVAAPSFAVDALASELYRHDAEVDAAVRTECERMRAGLEHARKRQCQALVHAASAAAARRLREKEAELDTARRRAAELEECLRQAAAECQAWCGLARGKEAIASGLRATLDRLVRAAPALAEGFGESDFTSPAALPVADDASSCCVEAEHEPKVNAAAHKRAFKSCGEGEASVLLLPCSHLCLCKACEPRLDVCPVCLAAKNASIHIAIN